MKVIQTEITRCVPSKRMKKYLHQFRTPHFRTIGLKRGENKLPIKPGASNWHLVTAATTLWNLGDNGKMPPNFRQKFLTNAQPNYF